MKTQAGNNGGKERKTYIKLRFKLRINGNRSGIYRTAKFWSVRLDVNRKRKGRCP